MDANITLSLRDIYEEFLYNRDIGHEQIMYIIEQQQKQEREQPKTPEQKQEIDEEKKEEEEEEEANSDNSNLTTFLQELDDNKKKILKDRKTIPKFKYNKDSLNNMIYHNLDVFKYNSEKLNLRERYRDVNTELTNITGFANDSVECIKNILTMPEIKSEMDQSEEQEQLKSDKKSADSQGTVQPKTSEVAAIEEAIVNAINAQIAVNEDTNQSGDANDGSSKTGNKDNIIEATTNAQTMVNEKSDANEGVIGNSSETVTNDQSETNVPVAAIEEAIVNAINEQTTDNEDPDQSGYETDESSKKVQPKTVTNDSVVAIEEAIANPINTQITVNEDSGANKGVIGNSSDTVQEPVPGPAKKEDLPFLDLIREKELGNTQNENIVAPINEQEDEEENDDNSEQQEETGDNSEQQVVVVTGGGDAKGGDAIKHLNDEKNNPFLNVSKEMIEKACNLTADSCKISKKKCVLSAENIAKELNGETEINMDPLKNFIRRHDKYNSFIKYIYGKYFTLHSNKDTIINELGTKKKLKKKTKKKKSSTFATEIVKDICKVSSGSIAKSLSHGSYGNINLIANFFEDDIFDVETKRIEEVLPKIFADIKKIRENIENIKKYQAWVVNGANDKDKNDYIKEGETLAGSKGATKVLKKEESKLTTEVAKVNVDTFMNLYAGLNLVCIYGYNIFDDTIDIHKTIIKNLGIMMAMYEIESLDNHVRIARLNGHKEVADSLEKINLASKDEKDIEIRKKVGATFENYFKLLKQSIMADIKENKYDADGVRIKSEGEEKYSAEVKGAKSAADLVKEEAGKKAEKTAENANKQTPTTVDTSEGQEDATTAKEAKDPTDEQSGKMNDVLSNKDEDKDTETKNTDSDKGDYKKYFTDCKDFGKEGDSTENKMKDLIKRFISEKNEEKEEEKNYIKIIQNCFTFNVIPWHVVKHTIDEMLNNDNGDFSGLFDGLQEKKLGNDDNKKTLLDQFFTDAFYWNTYKGEDKIKIDFRVKVITSIVRINDVYKSIRNLYIQNIQRVLQTKTSNDSKTFIDKFKESPMNPIYQKILYDYFYKTYILKEGKGLKYFTKLYVSSSVEGIKIIYEGLENQVIRISQTNNEKFFMHAPGVTKNSNYNDDNLLDEIGNEAKLYFYDEKDKSFILDMMQKINIEEIDKILSGNQSNMGIVYKKRIHELRKYLNYFNIFMVAQAGNMKFIGKAYNRLRKQLKSILDNSDN